MSAAIDLASWVLLAGGGLCCLIGAIGMLRMPDFYTRLHAASLSDTPGAGLILAGLLLQAGWSLVAVKLVAIGLLLFFTSPAATHAIAKAALGRGLKPLLAGGEATSKR
jgi:multicomponent Na+:H+ antiporter subunit G